ncbi:TPA: SEC10/PgrA surface exclusion domain-containing protein [Streptococcus suis]|nr:SEC10/PgrA surface exclusion domain-containing protein [Streptococcus suis]HEM6363918.1 SEC10/PgrA surface exclusion domain-containing protein [Streptococcus suis]HEM6403779.1 SEC10/PgrA surface exclusion domain-containing protein [Streptococcus suis]
MAKSTFKSLAATTAITLATVGTPALAEETTQTVEATTDAVVSTTEAPKAEAPKTSANIKPALDAQTQVVSDIKGQVDTAQDAATQADQAQATAQADVDAATQAVKDAETNAANATPANIAANQADQAANLADQQANAKDTEDVNAQITAQTQTVSDAQTAVDTAQSEKDAADADVAAKDASVKATQAAIDGTGVEQAQANLTQAKTDVKTATTDVDNANKAVDTAKKADTDRDAKIKAAETDVKTKSDAVTTASIRVTAAQGKVSATTDTLTKANDAVTKAQDALKNIDTVTIADLSQFKADKAEGDSDFMTDSGADVIQTSTVSIGKNSKTIIVDIDNLTNEQKISASQLYVQGLTQIRQSLNGLTSTAVTQAAIDLAQLRADQYKARGTSPLNDGHIGAGVENLIRLGSKSTIQTEEDLKHAVYNALLGTSFADAPSNWGHLQANLNFANNIGIAVANINGDYWLVVAFTNEGTPIANPNDPAKLQAALTKAQADQTQAQTASDQAKAELTKASSDYAAALDAKTQAEKVLASATATPLQTQVAENNLRLAKIALQNAQAREVEAQKAVDNFSADLATKKAKLDEAKAALTASQADAATKATALETAKAELTKQQGTLDSLNKDKAALLAEKDRLVEEAKALATELKGYLEAPAILEKAKAELSDKEATLKEAIAKAEVAHNALKDLSVKLAEEESKLAELQAEYDRLKDLEDKAKSNVIATLPNGGVIAVPKDAPTVGEKPVLTLSTKKADTPTKTGNNTNQAGITVTQTASGEKVTYSRVARAKALPQTGEQESLLALFGVAVLSSLGLAATKRRKQG